MVFFFNETNRQVSYYFMLGCLIVMTELYASMLLYEEELLLQSSAQDFLKKLALTQTNKLD